MRDVYTVWGDFMRAPLVSGLLLLCFSSACGDQSPSAKPVAQSNAATSGDEPISPNSNLAPNPIYPIEVSIAGNAPLEQAAAAAEARSKALDEICMGLDIAAEFAPFQPLGGGCPRVEATVEGGSADMEEN